MESIITPPPELRRLWAQQAQRISPHDPVEWMQYASEKAAQWGADQELEACIELIKDHGWFANPEYRVNEVRAARRPKPPSLKEQALKALSEMEDDCLMVTHSATIRRALEALPDD